MLSLLGFNNFSNTSNTLIMNYGNGLGGTTKTGTFVQFACAHTNTLYKIFLTASGNTHTNPTQLFPNAAAVCCKYRNVGITGFYQSACYSAKDTVAYEPYRISYLTIGF